MVEFVTLSPKSYYYKYCETDWGDEKGFCKCCGWSFDYPHSHAEHFMSGWGLGIQTGCKYIESKYTYEIVEGEMECEKK